MTGGSDIPLWDLNPVYGGFEDPAFKSDKTRLRNGIDSLGGIISPAISGSADSRTGRTETPADKIVSFIDQYNFIRDLAENLSAFCYAKYSVNTEDVDAIKEMDSVDEMLVPLKGVRTDFRNFLTSLNLEELYAEKPSLSEYRFFLEEESFYQKHQLSKPEEELAADLARCGGDAWSRLQDALSSQITLVWDESTGEKKTIVELRNLAFHDDRAVRQKAFDLELKGWKSMKTPLAFSLNGVKGTSVALNRRRGYESALEVAVRQSRISPKTLDALIESLEGSLPDFQLYLQAKARLLGLNRCSFFDIFAPVGKTAKVFAFSEARQFIGESFFGFSREMADFAAKAFEKNWIDALPRAGKVGGAYCTDLPLVRESRILCNFNGTFYAVKTIAHELGHAYHHHVIKDQCHIHKTYPMVLAETASIFAETLITDKALAVMPEGDKLSVTESMLQDETQVIVDILSRFLFEREVFERRPSGDLSAEEFCDIMMRAQKQTYGDGLDASRLHPYMWAVKSHYYRPDLAYYNFPYAFGLLLGLSLFAAYKQEGPGFADKYRALLSITGKYSAVDVTGTAGFHIEDGAFWRQGMDIIREHIRGFIRLADKIDPQPSHPSVNLTSFTGN